MDDNMTISPGAQQMAPPAQSRLKTAVEILQSIRRQPQRSTRLSLAGEVEAYLADDNWNLNALVFWQVSETKF